MFHAFFCLVRRLLPLSALPSPLLLGLIERIESSLKDIRKTLKEIFMTTMRTSWGEERAKKDSEEGERKRRRPSVRRRDRRQENTQEKKDAFQVAGIYGAQTGKSLGFQEAPRSAAVVHRTPRKKRGGDKPIEETTQGHVDSLFFSPRTRKRSTAVALNRLDTRLRKQPQDPLQDQGHATSQQLTENSSSIDELYRHVSPFVSPSLPNSRPTACTTRRSEKALDNQ